MSQVYETKRHARARLTPWLLRGALAVVAIGLPLYRLVFVGTSLANWGLLLFSAALVAFYVYAVAYLEGPAQIEERELGARLGELRGKIERLEKDIEGLPDELDVPSDDAPTQEPTSESRQISR